MLLQMVYTRDVNQLSSGAEPALTLLQRESAAPGSREAFVYEATRGESRRLANIFSPQFFFSLLHTRSPVETGINAALSSSKAAVAARRCHFGEGFERKTETGKQAAGGFVLCAAGRAAAYPPGTETHERCVGHVCQGNIPSHSRTHSSQRTLAPW